MNTNNIPQFSSYLDYFSKKFASYDKTIDSLIKEIKQSNWETSNDVISSIQVVFDCIFCDNESYLIESMKNDSCEEKVFTGFLDDGKDFFTTEELKKGSVIKRLNELEEQTKQMTDLLFSINKRLDLIENKLNPPDTFDAEIIE